jgi:hypothetical protein
MGCIDSPVRYVLKGSIKERTSGMTRINIADIGKQQFNKEGVHVKEAG